MSKISYSVFASVSLAASLFCLSALADTPTPTTPPATPTTQHPVPRVSFECGFEGGSSDKSGGWFEHCKAEGYFFLDDRNDGGELKVICDNGDDDDMGDKIYDGDVRARLDRDDRTLILKGERHDDHMPPVITVSDIDRDDLCPTTMSYGGDDGCRFSSQLEFTHHGNDYVIPGQCRFKCEPPAPPMN